MKIKFRLYSLLIVLLLCRPLFASCHGSAGLSEFAIPDEFDMTRNYEISFWAKNDTNVNQMNIYKNAISDFEKIYPNIKVNLKAYTNYDTIYNDVITNIATKTTPNVCITYPDHIATYMTGSNTVVPLDGLMNDPAYGLGGEALLFDSPSLDSLVPQFLDECAINGVHYALPYMRSTEACYINKTYVEKLGYTVPDMLTWDFIWEVSEAAMQKGDDGNYIVNGQEVLIPFIYKSTDNMMIQALYQLGAGYSDTNGNLLLFDDEKTKKFLYTIADHTKNGAFSTFKISGYPANYLNAGRCIFAIDSTAGSTWMGAEAPLLDISEDEIVEFETVVRAVPQFDTSSPKMISQGPSVCVFNKDDAQEVLASWIFTQYLLTNDVQIPYSQTEGYLPVTYSAQNDPSYVDYLAGKGDDKEFLYDVKLAASELLRSNIENTFTTPVFNGSAALRSASGQLIENVAKSVRRKETIDDEYLKKTFSDISSMYRLDQFSSNGSPGSDDGDIPLMSKVLLYSIAAIWLIMGAYVLANYVKNKRNSKKA